MKRILVVDDQVEILEVVNIILTAKNFLVNTVADWRKINERIISFHPDLILLDVSLGGADGRDICARLKSSADTQNIPVVLFSAHHNLVNNLNDCKADAVITKPFDTNQLITTIDNNLN